MLNLLHLFYRYSDEYHLVDLDVDIFVKEYGWRISLVVDQDLQSRNPYLDICCILLICYVFCRGSLVFLWDNDCYDRNLTVSASLTFSVTHKYSSFSRSNSTLNPVCFPLRLCRPFLLPQYNLNLILLLWLCVTGLLFAFWSFSYGFIIGKKKLNYQLNFELCWEKSFF